MHTPHQTLLTWSLVVLAGCHAPLDFGSDTESKAQTYKTYVADGGDAWFDPIGASDIYHRYFSTRDGYDAWWRFIIPESDCDKFVAAVANDNNGPSDIEWNGTTAYPSAWRPDDSPPTWWTRNGTKSVHWCYGTGSAERHHGWYFLYDSDSHTLYCWHWNHQWSSAQCTHTSAR